MKNLTFKSWLEDMTNQPTSPNMQNNNPQDTKVKTAVNQAVAGVLKSGGDATKVKDAVSKTVTNALQSGQMQAKDVGKYIGTDDNQKKMMKKK